MSGYKATRRSVAIGASIIAATSLTISAPAFAHPTSLRPASHKSATSHTSKYAVTAKLAKKSVATDQRVRVRGTVRPKAAHKPVDLQALEDAHWVTVAKTRLTKSSAYTLSYQPADTGTLRMRVAVPKTAAHSAGDSSRLAVKVTAAPYTAVSANSDSTACALVRGGTAQCWGGDQQQLAPTPQPFTNVVSVAAIGATTCAVVKSGSVKCVGPNDYGLLGIGSERGASSTPVTVVGISDVKKIVAGSLSFCALRTNHTVWCWGYNGEGELGNGSSAGFISKPVQVSGITTVSAIGAGSEEFCAVLSSGSVSCWGSTPGTSGGLGPDNPTPVAVSGLTGRAVSVEPTYDHACAVLSDGTMDCWGRDNDGQLGDGGTAYSAAAVLVSDVTTARVMSVGNEFTCAVLSGGTISCWGADFASQLGIGSGPQPTGKVTVLGVTNATDVASDGTASCARLSTGRVTCWGEGDEGELGNAGRAQTEDSPVIVSPPQWRVTSSVTPTSLHATQTAHITGTVLPAAPGRILTLSDLNFHTNKYVAVKRITLSATGRFALTFSTKTIDQHNLLLTIAATRLHSQSTVPFFVDELPTVTSVSVGDGHGCATMATGQSVCWGDNREGDLGFDPVIESGAFGGPPITFKKMTAGLAFSCGLLASGHVDCWGDNSDDQLGDNGVAPPTQAALEPVTAITTATAIAAGEDSACAVLKSGAVKCWGAGVDGELGNGDSSNSPVPVTVTGITNATAVTVGNKHACALLKTHAVKCWGEGSDGQLGDDSFDPSPTPVTVTGLNNAASVSAGYNHTCAVLISGHIDCWGDNFYGQLGTDQPTNHDAPVAVPAISTATSVSAGGMHTCAVVASGHLMCWGQGDLGELGNGHTDTSATPVTVSTIADATAVSSGFDDSCAIRGGKTDTGDLWCWGNAADDELGQNGTGSPTSDIPVAVND